MSTSVVLSDLFGRAYDELDGSLKSRVMDFVVKLQRDPTAPGLDLKQPAGVQDRRVRTARVNDSWRAVLLALPDAAGYILVAVKPHDDAYTYAGSLVASVNEVTGALEIVNTERLGTALQRVETTVGSPAMSARTGVATPLLSSVRARDLVRLGVQNQAANQLLAITDEATLFDLVDALPRSQGDAVLDLYSGLSPDEVWANLVAEEPVGTVDTADLTTALARPLSRLSFTDLAGEDSIDELRAVLEGSLAAWRVWLHPLQRRLAGHGGWNGPYRVTGGAGTGKTVTALHRARHLARRADGPVLLTTFTRNLADALRAQLIQLAGAATAAGVDVLNLDALALRVLRAGEAGRTLMERASLVSDTDSQLEPLWDVARGPAEGGWSLAFLRDEWSQVVLGNTLTTEAEYLSVSRSGRGQRLSRPQRAQVWRVFERFGQLLRAQGLVTFTQVAADAALLLRADDNVRRSVGYAHAVVDEAQDLHPAHWRLLRALVPPGQDDLFIVGDAHQRIYGRPVPLSRFGIETRGRSRRLTVNYRTSRQILRWSLHTVDPEADDLDGSVESLAGARSLFDGPEPAGVGHASAAQENAALVEQVRRWISDGLKPDEIAVFVRERRTVGDVVGMLGSAGLPAAEVSATEARTEDGVRVLTMHRAKGLEFRAVALPKLGAAEFPPHYVRTLTGDEAQAAERTERNLLYVAGSRARERLWISWTGHPSRLLPVTSRVD